MFQRVMVETLQRRLEEPRRFIQVLAGGRQTGKTTLARQALDGIEIPGHYATADEPTLKDRSWLEQQWETARLLGRNHEGRAVLVLDEIQKIPDWSETVKRLWDADTAEQFPLHVVVLGSAPLLLQSGLSESLAGRFELIRVPHWSLAEMQEAFGWSLEQYVYYGGYPGSASLIDQPDRWRRYILDSLVETTISRDILLMRRVDKPALLRRVFELGCRYSSQILSYTKMLGQLQDAGNTTTLAHYLELLEAADLLEGLGKFAGETVRRRASSPKFQVHNNALVSAQQELGFSEVRHTPEVWGRLVESAVGAWLVNAAKGSAVDVHYWNRSNREVDFVLSKGSAIVAIEVKSSSRRGSLSGMDAMARDFDIDRKLLVGADGIPLETFLTTHPDSLF